MNTTPEFVRNIEMLLRSHHEIVFVRTAEHEDLERHLLTLCDRLRLPFFKWTCTKGLIRSRENGAVYGSQLASQALAFIEAATMPAVYHFQGGFSFEEAGILQKLRDATARFSKERGGLVISALEMNFPAEIRMRVSEVEWPLPSIEELRGLFSSVMLERWQHLPQNAQPSIHDPVVARFLEQVKGMTLSQARRQITQATADDGKLTEVDLKKVVAAKQDWVRTDGLLEFISSGTDLGEIADLKNLKDWLQKRKTLIHDPQKARAFNLPFPKGILLVGVQGCGKSFCAKAVSREWQMPLIKLDPSRLFDKYVGESEKNVSRALKSAESMAPTILWIDEIEKMFATGGGESDGGTTLRLLGLFLTWLQERAGDVFVVATANDIQRLPPELVRKGRFDEIFFVDLPVEESRRDIFRIHLGKRGQDPARFDLAGLSARTEGFSGAEIEQVVVSGCYTAINENQALSNEILAREISVTRPLSQTMAERVESLRNWARERTVSAH